MAFINTLNATALIYRRQSTVSNGMGPSTDTGPFDVVLAPLPVGMSGPQQQLSVPCRVAQQSQKARLRTVNTGDDATVGTMTIFTMYRTDLLSRDSFVIAGQKYDTFDLEDPGLTHDHLEFAARKVS